MHTWTHVAGWTLLHFVWQGFVIALAAATALRTCRTGPARIRYALACAALAGMTATPIVTATLLSYSGARIDRPADVVQTAASDPIASVLEESPENAEPQSRAIGGRVETALAAAVWIWLGGATFLFLRTASGWWRVRRLQTASRSMEASRWQAAGDRIAARLGIAFAVRIVESALVDTPAVIGWLAPVILLPLATMASLTPFQVRAILAHELAHVRRNDYLVNLLQTLAETFLFYHPAVWWLSARIRAEREHCCDDVAVDVCGDSAGYAAALAALDASRAEGAWSLAATGGPLLERIRRLLNVPTAEDARMPTWPVVAAMLLLGVVSAAAAQHAGFFLTGGLTGAPQSASGRPGEQWQMQSSEHFDVYHGGGIESQLDAIGERAERASRQISSDLRHDLSFRVPIVAFRTRREMQQILQGWTPQTIAATFNVRDRGHLMLLPIDGPAEDLNGLIAHELTHMFEFDILPRASDGLVPTWVMEGLADYERGSWAPRDVAQLKVLAGAALTPSLTASTVDSDRTTRRSYNLGHAAFEFIEATYGKDGIRRLLVALRMSELNGAANIYESAFKMTAAEFDAAFEQYLAGRFPGPRSSPPGVKSERPGG